MRIFCDFDGTISAADTTDLLLGRFADPAWEAIEARWVAGEIDAATCMAAQVALVNADLSEIDALLDTVALRDGFLPFLRWVRDEGIDFTIVSDGVDHVIRHILMRHGIADVPVIANRLVAGAPGSGARYALEQPWRKAVCSGGGGVCKCAVVDGARREGPDIFIGDGRSDFCVSTRPDILFATAGLQRFCADRAIAHHPFESFADIQAVLAPLRIAHAA